MKCETEPGVSGQIQLLMRKWVTLKNEKVSLDFCLFLVSFSMTVTRAVLEAVLTALCLDKMSFPQATMLTPAFTEGIFFLLFSPLLYPSDSITMEKKSLFPDLKASKGEPVSMFRTCTFPLPKFKISPLHFKPPCG